MCEERGEVLCRNKGKNKNEWLVHVLGVRESSTNAGMGCVSCIFIFIFNEKTTGLSKKVTQKRECTPLGCYGAPNLTSSFCNPVVFNPLWVCLFSDVEMITSRAKAPFPLEREIVTTLAKGGGPALVHFYTWRMAQ